MKRFLVPFLAALALPTVANANVDPKIAEICMKATDFQGCVKSMSGQKNNNLSIKSGYDSALIAFEKGDTLKAMKLINSYIKKNPNSKEGFLLRAFINTYDLSEFDKALEDIDQALEIDQNYASKHHIDRSTLHSSRRSVRQAPCTIQSAEPWPNLYRNRWIHQCAHCTCTKHSHAYFGRSARHSMFC